MGSTPTPTRMRLSCNFVNVYTNAYRVQYTFTRVYARIPNGQPREDPGEEKRACRSSRRTSRRGLSCVSSSWQAQRGRRHAHRVTYTKMDDQCDKLVTIVGKTMLKTFATVD